MFSFFNLISLFYAYRAIQLGYKMWQQRELLRSPWLTRQLAIWGENGAFLLAVPPGVFIHELGHAVMVWAFGGQVVEFRVYGYWGYVLPAGIFTPNEDWFISLAGTIGSILYAGALYLIYRRHAKPFWRHFGLRAARFHFIFALIYYPLFTAFAQFGDWRTIYDFAATPIPSAITAVFHAIGLLAFYLSDRAGVYEIPFFDSQTQADEYRHIQEQVRLNPHDVGKKLEAARLAGQYGDRTLANKLIDGVLKENANHGEAYLVKAQLLGAGKKRPPSKALKAYETALQLGLPKATQRALAMTVLGNVAHEKGRKEEAANYLNDAVDQLAAFRDSEPRLAHTIYNQRGHMHRRNGQYQLAAADWQAAISIADIYSHVQEADAYRKELATLEQQQMRQRR